MPRSHRQSLAAEIERNRAHALVSSTVISLGWLVVWMFVFKVTPVIAASTAVGLGFYKYWKRRQGRYIVVWIRKFNRTSVTFPSSDPF